MALVREPTTGAADDLQRATEIARAMVSRYGMTEEVGQAAFIGESPRFPKAPFGGERRLEMSQATEAVIDKAVRRLIEEAFARARDILRTCRSVHEDAARRLLEKESLAGEELAPIAEAVRALMDEKAEAVATQPL